MSTSSSSSSSGSSTITRYFPRLVSVDSKAEVKHKKRREERQYEAHQLVDALVDLAGATTEAKVMGSRLKAASESSIECDRCHSHAHKTERYRLAAADGITATAWICGACGSRCVRCGFVCLSATGGLCTNGDCIP